VPAKVKYTVTLDKDIFERLLIARRDSGIPVSVLVNAALKREIALIIAYCCNHQPKESDCAA